SRMLSGVDLNNVERIEVINGASAAFGNGATGGAINFITKQGNTVAGGKPEITASAGLRAFTTNITDSVAPEFSAGFRGDAGLVDVVANMSAKYSRDYYDGRGNHIPSDAMLGQGGGDNIADYNGLVKLGKSFDARRLEFSVNAVHLDQEPDYFTNYATRPVSVLSTSPYTGQSIAERSEFYRASYSDGAFALGNLRLDLSYSDIERRTALSPLSAANTLVYYTSGPFNRLNTNGQLTLFSQQMALQTAVTTPLPMLLPGMKLTWGADIGQDKTTQRFLDNVDAIAPMKQNNYAAYAQLDAPVLDWLRLRGGARYDRFDVDLADFTRPAYTTGAAAVAALKVRGGSFSYDAVVYNAGLVVDVLPGLEAFGGMSQGYSLPDYGGFTRRAGVQGVTSNFSLLGPQPQKVTTYDVGLRGQNDRLSGGVSGYVSESDLGSTFIVSSNQISQQKERIYGLEAYGEYSLTDAITLGSTLSWKEGKFDSNRDGDIDAYLPNNRIGSPLKLVLFAGWEIDSDWSLHGETVFYSARTRFDGTNVTKLESGFLVNALANYKLGQGDLS
ncbi:TonB-dependent receptor, partial [Ferrovibrio sp.]